MGRTAILGAVQAILVACGVKNYGDLAAWRLKPTRAKGEDRGKRTIRCVERSVHQRYPKKLSAVSANRAQVATAISVWTPGRLPVLWGQEAG